MSNTSITKTQNNSDSQEKSPERFIPHDVVVSYEDITNKDISHAEFRVYCAILGYGKKYGHLSLSTTAFLKDNPVFTLRQFQRHSQSLEDKGFLLTIQHPVHRKGSMRYLIPKPYYDRFISYILRKYHSAAYAAKVKTFFEGGDEKVCLKYYKSQCSPTLATMKIAQIPYKLKCSTRRLTTPPADTALNDASINNINIIKEEENSERGESPPLFKASGKEKMSQDLVKKELSKLGLDWKKGWHLSECCKKEFEAYDNPIAGLIAAMKGGYADEKIHKAEEKLAKEKAAIDESEKKAKRRQMAHQVAKAIQTDLHRRKVDKYTVCLYERNTQISACGTNTCANFIYDEHDTIDRLLQFAQKNDIKIDLKEKKDE